MLAVQSNTSPTSGGGFRKIRQHVRCSGFSRCRENKTASRRTDEQFVRLATATGKGGIWRATALAVAFQSARIEVTMSSGRSARFEKLRLWPQQSKFFTNAWPHWLSLPAKASTRSSKTNSRKPREHVRSSGFSRCCENKNRLKAERRTARLACHRDRQGMQLSALGVECCEMRTAIWQLSGNGTHSS